MSQLELHLPGKLVDDDTVARQPSLTRAIVVCADLGGFEDKKAASAAGVDPATWSKIKSGQANFPQENLKKFQIKCGNWLPLQWANRDCGFEPVYLESELEKQLRHEREINSKLVERNEWLMSVVQGRQV